MADIIGTRDQVDEYIGSRLVVAAYQGSRKYFDAYSDVTGNLPLYFNSRVNHSLKDYKLYGTSEGAGVETENLVSYTLEKANIDSTGRILSQSASYLAVAEIEQGKTYSFMTNDVILFAFFSSKPEMSSLSYDGTRHGGSETGNLPTFTAPITGYVCYRNTNGSPAMLVEGAVIPTSCIPPGYQIPLTLTSGQNTGTYPLYIGSTKLGAEEYLDYESGKVWRMWNNLFDAEQIVEDSAKTSIYISNGWLRYSTGTSTMVININGQIGETYQFKLFAKNFSTTGPNNIRFNLIYADDTSTTTSSNALAMNEEKYIKFSSNPEKALVRVKTDNSANRYAGLNISKTLIIKSNEMPETPLQPTDPPAPLPEITAYEGENTLSSTETVGSVTVTGRISATYKQLEYLEATGTQYIETDIVPTYSDAVETELQFGAVRNSSGKQGVFGTIYDNRRFAVVMGSTSADPYPVYFYYGYPWQSAETDISFSVTQASLNQKQKFVLSPNLIQLGSDSKTPIAVSQSAPQKTFIIFGIWDNDGIAYPFAGYDYMRCYGMTFKVNDTITHNFIPVERNSDGALGMLDTITNKFYTNAGTGTFVKGGYV